MDDETRAAVKDALVREVIGLSALALILFALGPGRVYVPALIKNIRLRFHPVDVHGPAVRKFASDISRWDHEQASQQDRKPAPGGCGCGG